MKKGLLFIFWIIVFTLIICGCGKKGDENNFHSNNSVEITRTKTSIPQEERISSFSTDMIIKESSRLNNISITCSKLNDIVIKNGETFSFCDTVGRATAEAGYQKADIFDANGNIIKGYGGGNCQVSSTLYNAVLAIPELEIVERHPHSRKVDYVEAGKDAAVAYGSIDFKFKNNAGYDIKLIASSDSNAINISLLKIF